MQYEIQNQRPCWMWIHVVGFTTQVKSPFIMLEKLLPVWDGISITQMFPVFSDIPSSEFSLPSFLGLMMISYWRAGNVKKSSTYFLNLLFPGTGTHYELSSFNVIFVSFCLICPFSKACLYSTAEFALPISISRAQVSRRYVINQIKTQTEASCMVKFTRIQSSLNHPWSYRNFLKNVTFEFTSFHWYGWKVYS